MSDANRQFNNAAGVLPTTTVAPKQPAADTKFVPLMKQGIDFDALNSSLDVPIGEKPSPEYVHDVLDVIHQYFDQSNKMIVNNKSGYDRTYGSDQGQHDTEAAARILFRIANGNLIPVEKALTEIDFAINSPAISDSLPSSSRWPGKLIDIEGHMIRQQLVDQKAPFKDPFLEGARQEILNGHRDSSAAYYCQRDGADLSLSTKIADYVGAGHRDSTNLKDARTLIDLLGYEGKAASTIYSPVDGKDFDKGATQRSSSERALLKLNAIDSGQPAQSNQPVLKR